MGLFFACYGRSTSGSSGDNVEWWRGGVLWR